MSARAGGSVPIDGSIPQGRGVLWRALPAAPQRSRSRGPLPGWVPLENKKAFRRPPAPPAAGKPRTTVR